MRAAMRVHDDLGNDVPGVIVALIFAELRPLVGKARFQFHAIVFPRRSRDMR